MEYKHRDYEILTKKDIYDSNIITISDLNWNHEITRSDINDLIVQINDFFPRYVFILGNVCTYYNLEDPETRENIKYFFQLLSCITKSFIVFGHHDYRLSENEKLFLPNIDKLLSFYQTQPVNIINNNYTEETEFNVVGFNKSQLTYQNIDEAKHELKNLLNKINQVLDKNKFNVLITHYELNHLKLNKELLKTFDLILTGSSHTTIKRTLFKKEEDLSTNEKAIIKTGGVCKGEISLIKIKKI